MHFKIFNPDLVNIVILPHSKGGVKTTNQNAENVKYCQRLKEKNIILNPNVVIIDGVHSGTGILALESALKFCFPDINVYRIAINAVRGVSKIPVNVEIILPCEPKFSDVFPRLVTSFHPTEFNNGSKFITNFIGLETNPVAEMIIDISQNYPEMQVEKTLWYILNNEITEEILVERQCKKTNDEKIKRSLEQQKKILKEEANLKKQGGYFVPIILDNPKRYQCPICKSISGTAIVLNPTDLSLFTHCYYCENRFKRPMEVLPLNFNNNIESKKRKKKSNNSSNNYNERKMKKPISSKNNNNL
jgi:hypothetical protein